jgi:hypothetical protein
MNRIIIAGLYRSGSTWQFNAIRIILKQAGIVFNQYNIYQPELSLINEGAQYEICKLHKFGYFALLNRAGIDKLYIITSVRRFDEALNSYKRCFPKEYATNISISPNWWNEALADYLRWRLLSNYDMSYDQLTNNKLQVILNLIMVLNFSNVDPHTVLSELETLLPPTDKEYDPVTCYFRNHISQ